MKLIIVRHGESEGNTKEIFAGITNVPLTERGREQAEETAGYILENYKIDKIYSSPRQRAYDTALPVSKALGIEIEKCDAFMEIDGGKWEGMLFADLPHMYEKEFDIWLNRQSEAICPGGESVKEVYKRANDALLKIAEENDGKTVLITSHATPVKAICCGVLHGDVRKMSEMKWVSNASVTEIEYKDGIFSMIKMGHDAHLKMSTSLPENI